MLGEILAEIVGAVVGELVVAAGAAAYDAVVEPKDEGERSSARWLDDATRAALGRLSAGQRDAVADALVFAMRYDGAEADPEWARVDQAVAAMGARDAAAAQLLARARDRVSRLAGHGDEAALVAAIAGAFPDAAARAALLGAVTAVATADPTADARQREVIAVFARALGVPAPPAASTPTCRA